jgi:uncharacterized protein (UPF0335 family)
MLIYRYELKKLLKSAAVWGFIAVCLLFNIIIISNSGNAYADFVSTVAEDTGYILDQSFYEKLSQVTASDKKAKYYLEQLKNETDGVTDVFEGYEVKDIADIYINVAGLSGFFAKTMRDKYTALQKVVEEKAERDESLTLYFAGATHHRHNFLFGTLTGWLFTEAVLVSVLLVLLSIGYENIHGTENLVYSTKKGRLVLRPKFAASVTVGFLAYALLALITLVVYFSKTEYGGVWRSSVSSLFNYRVDLIAGIRPFVTWYSFNILTYLMAMLAMGAGVVLCFMLMAFSIGMLVRNSYMAFLVLLIANGVNVVLPMQVSQTLPIGLAVRCFSILSPVWLWLKQGIWFTDGDIDIIWPHFEMFGLCMSLAVLTVLCLLATNYFRKRDFT